MYNIFILYKNPVAFALQVFNISFFLVPFKTFKHNISDDVVTFYYAVREKNPQKVCCMLLEYILGLFCGINE